MSAKKLTVEILANRKETPAFHLIRLARPAGFDFIPGQYVMVEIPGSGHETSFALASHPVHNYLELLINPEGVNARTICHAPVGTNLEISRPIGPGFPSEALRSKTIYLIGHGSAFSAFKPVIEELRKNRNEYGPIRLLYGVRHYNDFPFADILRDWMGSIEVYDIISRDPGDMRKWSGETGRVQDILVKLAPDPANAVALVAGSLEMERQVKVILEEFNFLPENILFNH